MSNKYSLVIQGPAHYHSLLFLDHYSNYFDDIVYSTYPMDHFVYDHVVKYDYLDKYNFVFNDPIQRSKVCYDTSNCHHQALTTINGIKQAKHNNIVKIRTDEYFYNLHNVIKIADSSKINFSNVFFRSTQEYPYHVSDHIIVSSKDMMLNAFNGVFRFTTDLAFKEATLKKFRISSSAKVNAINDMLVPEQIIGIFFVLSYDSNSVIDFIDLYSNITFFRDHFQIINVDNLGPYLLTCKNLAQKTRMYSDDYKGLFSYHETDINLIREYK